jgi:hypothetical protein
MVKPSEMAEVARLLIVRHRQNAFSVAQRRVVCLRTENTFAVAVIWEEIASVVRKIGSDEHGN